jgi:hypothetical protein
MLNYPTATVKSPSVATIVLIAACFWFTQEAQISSKTYTRGPLRGKQFQFIDRK